MKPFSKIPNVRKIREDRGMNQSEFWRACGITQSGGSRYEGGRRMPATVRELVRIVYVLGIDLASLKKA